MGDCLAMIKKRHPDVAELFLSQFSEVACESPIFEEVANYVSHISHFADLPTWPDLALGVRP